MSDIPNPFETQRQPSPGEHYATLSAEAAEAARIFGLNLTPQGQDALAVLLGEVDLWWKTSDGAKALRFALKMLPKLMKWTQVKED